jgi:hypothetical protein
VRCCEVRSSDAGGAGNWCYGWGAEVITYGKALSFEVEIAVRRNLIAKSTNLAAARAMVAVGKQC